jgi:hypothetical protein
MEQTEIIRKDVGYGDNHAWLVRRNGQHFVISEGRIGHGATDPQTQAFRATAEGEINSWDEVAGGHALTKEQVLAELTQRPTDDDGWVMSPRDVLEREEVKATCENCGCELGTGLQHADYPHEPGRLYDCPACEDHCHCIPGYAECIFEGEHNGLAEAEIVPLTEPHQGTSHYVAPGDALPVTSVPELNDRMDLDHVVRVLDGGRVVDAKDSYAPELIMFTDEDGQALPDSDAQLEEQAKSAGWRLLSGWTGQYSYSGPVMHPSESVGGRLAEHILETPGEYVVTAVEALGEGGDDGDEEPAGWAIAFREVPEA